LETEEGRVINPRRVVGHYARKIASRLRFSIAINIRGRPIRIPIVNGVGYYNCKPHIEVVDFFLEQIFPRVPGAFIDVGANIGQTLLKVVTIDAARDYIGFEVSTFCNHYLDELIALNGLARCMVVPIGLSDKLRSLEFQSASPSDTLATTVEGFWTDRDQRANRRRVLLEAGDSVLPHLLDGDIALIKIDVEGGELEVVRGLVSTLHRYRPLIITELLPYSCDASDPSPSTPMIMENRRRRMNQMSDLIREVDYVPFRMLPTRRLEQTFEFDMPTYDEGLCNYLLLPTERIAEFGFLDGAVRSDFGTAGASAADSRV
jgi:FkbM family methyltransferase